MELLKYAGYCTQLFILFVFCGCTALPAQELDPDVSTTAAIESAADSILAINFVESAPKDRFSIRNAGSCMLEEVLVEFDLSQSAGKLIFDVTESGAGVEVFQPFEVVAGNITQVNANGVTGGVADGDSTLALRIVNLGAGEAASFTIDVDDTLPSGELGQIRVAGSEISGGLVSVTAGGLAPATGTFNAESAAQIRIAACE